MDYSPTLNLPKTDFPMKANLAQKEPEIQKKWEDIEIYGLLRKLSAGRTKYILHDGPPYANGHIHLGHALNKILKDIIVKYRNMNGYDAPYVPGWDCHGLPIEYQLMKELKLSKDQVNQVEFRKKASAFAKQFIEVQKEEFKRLGIFGDWDNPYVTLDFTYEAKIIEVFKELVKKDYIYKGLKPVHWCADCETALAEAEVEYNDHSSPSVFVKFLVSDVGIGLEEEADLFKTLTVKSDIYPALSNEEGNPSSKGEVYALIWTTTPWTLLANVAIAFHPDSEYALVKLDKEHNEQVLIIAKDLVNGIMEKVGIRDYKIIKLVKGEKLAGIKCKHPFLDRESIGILADFVTMEEGTGIVHIAPGHGEEDYFVGLKYNLPVIVCVDGKGRFKEEIPEFGGLYVFKANKMIIDKMQSNNSLVYSEQINHTYPYCWRCKNPVVFRATEQWFMRVDKNELRGKLLQTIKNIDWVPESGENRIVGMVQTRPDWCLSRQRYWGVPLPIFYCDKCNEPLLTEESITKVQEMFLREGSDAWFIRTPEEILYPKGHKFQLDPHTHSGSRVKGQESMGDVIKCSKCAGTEFRKETDILDVWFDSGVSHEAVLKQRKELGYPADLYLEGSDQHRGWFQVSLITALALNGSAPFKTVVTHGFCVDAEGKKMSKSLGNVIAPQEIIKKQGADILRLWVCSEDYTLDMRISDKIISHLVDAYRRMRNTFRYLIGNLYDYDPKKDKVKYDELWEIDQWTLHKLQLLIEEVNNGYEEFSFHRIFRKIHNFCATDLSSFYLNILKDRLYTFGKNSVGRRAAQTVLYELLETLVTILAPVISFTCEEVWQYLNKEGKTESVFLAEFPKVKKEYINNELNEKWQKIMDIYTEVAKPLEMARRAKLIGGSLEAKVVLYAQGDLYKFIKNYIKDLPMIFITSQVEVEQEPLKGYKADSSPAPSPMLCSESDLHRTEVKEIYYKSEVVSGLEAIVTHASGNKCVRCWNWSEIVGENSEHPQLCNRCVEVVENL